MTNAERQRAYRQRHLKDVEGRGERLNAVISVQAKFCLERLAAHHELSQRATLEQLLTEAERAVLAYLPAEQHSNYYEGRMLRRNGLRASGKG